MNFSLPTKHRAPARKARPAGRASPASSEILILPNGQILAHNLSPEMARVLAQLNPADTAMKRRARAKKL